MFILYLMLEGGNTLYVDFVDTGIICHMLVYNIYVHTCNRDFGYKTGAVIFLEISHMPTLSRFFLPQISHCMSVAIPLTVVQSSVKGSSPSLTRNT